MWSTPEGMFLLKKAEKEKEERAMSAECHAHIFMDGKNYKEAAEAHRNGPDERLIREHLEAYQREQVNFVRDGGDPYGAGLLARELAPEHGITYRTPGFAIHREGCYGKIVGRGYSSREEYRELLRELRRNGGNFVKIMTTGIMDFSADGSVTGEPLSREEVFWMVAMAHDAGYSVMAHTNGAQAVIDAVEAGVDSVEHGNFQDEESLQCMAEHHAVWVPTTVTVKNLIGNGRYNDRVLERIYKTQTDNIRKARALGVLMAAGSDAGAYCVLHGQGIRQEYQVFLETLGDTPEVRRALLEGETEIRRRFG